MQRLKYFAALTMGLLVFVLVIDLAHRADVGPLAAAAPLSLFFVAVVAIMLREERANGQT